MTTSNPDRNVIYGLYCLCHPTQIRYVGQTSRGADERLMGHTSMVQYRESKGLRLSHSQRWIKKHGSENIAISVLEVCATPDELDAAESRWIDSLEDLTNLMPGGNSRRGYKLPEEVSQARKGEGNPMYGRDRSELMDRIRALRGPMSQEEREKRAERFREMHLSNPEAMKLGRDRAAETQRTPEYRAEASERMKGSKNPMFGKKPTEEQRRAMSLACSPFTEDDVRSIRRLVQEGTPQKELALKYGVNPSTISAIIHRRRLGWVTD